MLIAAASTLAAKPSSLACILAGSKVKLATAPVTFCSSSLSSGQQLKTRKLVLYSKPGCCLCDGLKEKLQAAFLLSSPNPLHNVDLEVRDITTNPEWERAYQYEIPVLAIADSDGTEETMPRLSPRLGVELLQKKIAAALR